MSASGRDNPNGTVHAEFDTERDDPTMAVVETVSELEDQEITELPAVYDCIDSVIAHLFSDPPDDDADLEVTFSYEGYRITVRQDGGAEFRELPG